LSLVVVVCVVQNIEATSAIGSGQVIGEYTGNVTTREEFEHNKHSDVYVYHLLFRPNSITLSRLPTCSELEFGLSRTI